MEVGSDYLQEIEGYSTVELIDGEYRLLQGSYKSDTEWICRDVHVDDVLVGERDSVQEMLGEEEGV